MSGLLRKTIIFLLAAFTLYLLVLNVIFSFENNVVVYGLLVIPVFIVLFPAAYKIKVKPWIFALLIFISAFVFKGILAVWLKTQPVSDFNTFYQCALRLVNGDKTFGHGFYFRTWAYQTGPVMYYAAIIKLLGTGLTGLKLVNCLFMAGSNVFVYLIAKKISDDGAARFAALLYLLYPAPYFLASVLTNQHFAACMFLAAIYVLLGDGPGFAVKGAISGILLSFGNAVRPLGIVIAGAAILWGLIETIRTKKAFPAVAAGILLLCYLAVNFGISTMVRQNDINPEGLKNNFPTWKFVVGFNHESGGQFSYDDEKNIFQIEDFAERERAARQLIKERLSVGPLKLVELMNRKQTVMWAEFDTLRWSFYRLQNEKIVLSETMEVYQAPILKTEKMYYLFLFVLMLAGLCSGFKSSRGVEGITFIAMILLCYFGVHLLIEIQVRYRYFAVMLIFILASKGAEAFFSRIGVRNDEKMV